MPLMLIMLDSGHQLGATHLNKCPVQPYIPIYLIVLGVTSILSLILTFLASTRKQRSSYILSSTFLSMVHLFNFCWLIAGGGKCQTDENAEGEKRGFILDLIIQLHLSESVFS